MVVISSSYWKKCDDEILEDCVSGLKRMYPQFERDHIVASNVSRARQVLAISTLGYSDELRPEIRTSAHNIFIVNSAQIANGTLNVNETLGVVNQSVPSLEKAMREYAAHNQ